MQQTRKATSIKKQVQIDTYNAFVIKGYKWIKAE